MGRGCCLGFCIPISLKRVFCLNLSYETRLKLHPIEIREDKKNYIIEDGETGEYFEMPEACVRAIEMIEKGISLLEIEETLKAQYPSEEINLIEFAQQLIELEMVHEVNGKKMEYTTKKEKNLGFLWIPSALGKLFFNKVSVIFYVFLFMVNVFILSTNPHLFPHYKDLFIFDAMVFNILFYMLLSLILVLVHEFGHVLAMRAEGLATKLSVGHRLFLVVLETEMSSVWGLPPKKRNLLYLSGICFDMVMLFLALLVALLFPSSSSIILGISGIIVFDVFIRTIYQCCIYMKTDLYYVLENLTGCYNLLENAQAYFKQKIFSKAKRIKSEIFAGEKSIVILYGLFYLTGITLTLSLFFFFYIPQITYMVTGAIHGLIDPVSNMYFWDSLIVLLQLALGICLLLYSWRKTYTIQRGQR